MNDEQTRPQLAPVAGLRRTDTCRHPPVEAHHHELPELLAAVTPIPTTSGVFVRTPARNHDEVYISMSINMKTRNIEALDELTAKHSAQSRSQLCVVALRAHLTRGPAAEPVRPDQQNALP